MEDTSYFERTLFYDGSPAANAFYERCADQVFERDPSKTRIEARIQKIDNVDDREESTGDGNYIGLKKISHRHSGKQSSLGGHPGRVTTSPDVSLTSSAEGYLGEHIAASSPRHYERMDHEDSCSISSRASSTFLPTAVDQRRADSGPPLYPGPPRLECVKIAPNEIENFTRRTRNDFRLFYLQQRNSYSRLQITKADFETLLESCHVFPRFNEYVIGFGSKTSESEVGPPPLKFRPLYTSQGNVYRGFGKLYSFESARDAPC